jgi:hypothetical protein
MVAVLEVVAMVWWLLAGYVGCVASRELQTLFALVRAPHGRM